MRSDNLKNYINLYDPATNLEDFGEIDFSLKFDKLSVSHCEDIQKRWNKGGFQLCFKKCTFWVRKRNPEFLNKLEIVLKNGKKFCCVLDKYSQVTSDRFLCFKVQKKTKRFIGFNLEWKLWVDLPDYIDRNNQFHCNNWHYALGLGRFWKGYSTKYRDGDRTNLTHQNLVILPKGISLNQLYKRTNPQHKFCIFPEIESKLKNSSFREAICIMVYCNDKVWLNHNIVCIILDHFVETFRKNIEETSKEAYILLNMYAKKFGILPVLDRLVLTFWKFDIDCYHQNIISLPFKNEEVQTLLPENGIIRI